jgi:hypothetical protein
MIKERRIITDKQIVKICSQFRTGVIGRGKSKNKCYMVTAPLHAYLKFLKIECDLIEGFVTIGEQITNHFWITLPDKRIIDPTADQFNEIKGKDMPKVYLGEKPTWYMLKKVKQKS